MMKTPTKIVAYGASQGVHLPIALRQDSQFPFKSNDILEIEIDGDRLIITRTA